MILSGPILVSIFLASLGLLLGLLAGGAWLRLALLKGAAGDDPAPPEGRLGGEGSYLVFLLLLTAFGLRLLAWPLSYAALQSAVPRVSGAMCIFGVTRLCPLWANLLQGARPLLIAVLGGWLALRLTHSGLERRRPGRPRQRPPVERALFLASLVLLIADCVLEVTVFSLLRPDHPVYCCGSVYDLPGRMSSLIPGSLFGAQHAQLLLPLLHACGLLCAVTCLLAARAYRKARTGPGGGRRGAQAVAALIVLLHLGLSVLAFFAAMEVITPRLTGLPYHHCLYCLLGKTAAGPWLAVTLAAALLAGIWGSLLLPGPAGRRGGQLLLASGISIVAFLAITDAALLRVGGDGTLGACPACGRQIYDTVYLVEVVTGIGPPVLFCSPVCAMGHLQARGGRQTAAWVTVRDEFTGRRLDSGAAFFVEAGTDIEGLPEGNRWHAYQYQGNAYVMAFQLGGNVVADPFGVEGAGIEPGRAAAGNARP